MEQDRRPIFGVIRDSPLSSVALGINVRDSLSLTVSRRTSDTADLSNKAGSMNQNPTLRLITSRYGINGAVRVMLTRGLGIDPEYAKHRDA